MNDLSWLFFSIIGLLISSYLYYEFLKGGLLARIWMFGSLLGLLSFCFGLGQGNKVTDLTVLNGIAIFICAFSLEENMAFLIRKIKKKIQDRRKNKDLLS